MTYIDTIKTALAIADLNQLSKAGNDDAHRAMIALIVGVHAKGNRQAIADANLDPVIKACLPPGYY